MGDNVIDLASVRRRKKDTSDGWWEDEGVSVTVNRDPAYPGIAVVRTETSDLIIECGLDRYEARSLAMLLLNIANTPHGVAVQGSLVPEEA